MDFPPEVFLGSERRHNQNTVYLRRRGTRLAGTCVLTTSKTVPALGGLGEVATEPKFRRSGIASDLCALAVEDFRESGGQALFLGTGNPEAARIYYRLGWRRLAGSNVMANISADESPEEFLADYFRSIDPPLSVEPVTPAVRLPMVPLLLMPHDWLVLDANPAGMYSTRHCIQSSCLSLYPKYDAVVGDGSGAWFTAGTGGGQVVGMSTARLDDTGECRVDGFVHLRFLDSWRGLMEAAVAWGVGWSATRIRALLSVEDEEKQALFESLGFRGSGPGQDFALGVCPRIRSWRRKPPRNNLLTVIWTLSWSN